jgi:transcriptional regulator with XRE-family HTH domain
VFARNLKKYMDQSGKNQKELAEIVGVTAPTFNEWVNGKKYPRIDKIQKLADYFGILKSDLIEDKDIEEKKAKTDVAVDIVFRLKKDQNFLDAVKLLYDLDAEQLEGVTAMLRSLFK